MPIAQRRAVTLAKAYRLLKTILTTAADDGAIRRNPCRIKGGGSESSPERAVLTVAQVFALADAIAPRQGAGQAPQVKVERPAGRTILTCGAWSAGLALVDGRRDDQAHPSHHQREPVRTAARSSRSWSAPPEASWATGLCVLALSRAAALAGGTELRSAGGQEKPAGGASQALARLR
jgi:hypothetical protein